MQSLVAILIVVSALFAIYGAFQPGTTGVAAIAIGCLLAIFARIAQSHCQQDALLRALQPETAAAAPAVPSALSPGDDTKRILSYELPEYERQGWRVLDRQGMFVTVTRTEPAQ